MGKMRSFDISKQAVWEAYLKVKSNRGAAGIDNISIEMFEENLKGNLYKIWNRMSSGSYFPPPVRRVEIPKSDGKMRALGIPTVGDRIAQMVVKAQLEPELETVFHPDSYGYRPNRSARQALSRTRKRSWQKDWVVDLDIKGFFDAIPHDLMLKAVSKHAKEPWVRLYISRWLKAPVQSGDGKVEERAQGTPQGGVISPLLANLFLHYAFDDWMRRHRPGIPFERYADDLVVHCVSKEEAWQLKAEIDTRMRQCGLELHPEKTKVVYCKDSNRTGSYGAVSFDFLGYCFRPRVSRNRYGQYFVNFTPAISPKAKKSIYSAIRELGLHRKSGSSLAGIARFINPLVRGWIEYYGAFCKSELMFLVHHLDGVLCRWAMRKYKKQGATRMKAMNWLSRVKSKTPGLFIHWEFLRA